MTGQVRELPSLGLMTGIATIASVIPAQSAARLTIREALVYE